MGWIHGGVSESKISTELREEIHKLSTGLTELETKLLKLETASKLQITQWEDLYDKTMRALERFRKQARGSQEQVLDPHTAPLGPENMNRHELLRRLKAQNGT